MRQPDALLEGSAQQCCHRGIDDEVGVVESEDKRSCHPGMEDVGVAEEDEPMVELGV